MSAVGQPDLPGVTNISTTIVEPLLHEVFSGVARRLRGQLTTRTGVDSPTNVVSITFTTLDALYSDQRHADAGLWCAAFVVGAANPAYIVFERRLLSRLMGQLFGEGDVQGTSPRTGLVTEVEQVIGGRIAREIGEALSGCWSAAEPLVVRPGAVASSRRICAEVPPETPYTIVALEINGEVPHGRIFVALPTAVVDTLAPPLPAKKPPLARRTPKFERVLDVRLELTVELARLEVPLRRLHGLRVGDELPLGALGETCACVSNRRVFFGEPGTSGGLRSFRIKRRAASPSSPDEGDR